MTLDYSSHVADRRRDRRQPPHLRDQPGHDADPALARQLHWHPITAELGYVHTGGARMTVMDPLIVSRSNPVDP
jgi:hypothetical protein